MTTTSPLCVLKNHHLIWASDTSETEESSAGEQGETGKSAKEWADKLQDLKRESEKGEEK